MHIPDPDVVITNVGNPSSANVGDTINFTLNATNNGSDSATGINVTDEIPYGFNYNSYTSTKPGTTYNSATGIWTVGTLPDGATAWLTITGTAGTNGAGTNITNIATEINNEYPFTANIPNATIYVKEANVTLSQVGSYSGNTVTFNVTATNNGPDNATNITINDAIPLGLTNPIITSSIGSYSNGVWIIPSLANDTNATLNITGTSVPQSTTTNSATVTGQTEYNPTNPNTTTYSVYTPSVEMYVQQYPWYYDTKLGYVNTFNYYTYPIFVVDVENWGNDDATGVVVNEVIGTGYQYITCNPQGVGTATYNPVTTTITWDIGNMPTSGMAWMIVVTQAIATGDNTPAVTNTASLYHVDQYDVPNTYKIAPYSLNVPSSADMQVNQKQSVSTVNGSQYITYTITATNNGPDNANGVQVTDSLPAGLTYSSYNASAGTYNPVTGVWNIGNVNDNQVETLTITAKITGTGTITNTAAVSAEKQYNWNANNDAQTLDYTITGTYTPSVEMYVQQYPWYYDTKLGYVNTYNYNSYPVFVVDVENWGNDDATGVVVNEVIGAGYQYITCNPQGVGTATYNPVTRTITWDIGNMPTSGMAWMIVVTQAIATGDNTPAVTNTASLYHVDQYDVPNTYKIAPYSLNVPNSADMQVNQMQSVSTVNGSQYITYTITATNNGPDNANGVQVTDSLPAGLTYSSYNASAETYNPVTGVWNIGNVNDNQVETLTITAKITGTGTITNTAAVSAEKQYNWNANNDAQTIYTINQ